MAAQNTIPYVVTGGLGAFGAPPVANTKFLATNGFLAATTGAFTLAANAGTYALAGADATPKSARKLTADASAYALTGIAATTTRARTLIAEAGAYSETGTAATLSRTRGLLAAAGAYGLTGIAATLTGGRHLTLTANAGTYAVTGVAATLTGALPGPLPLGRQYSLITGGYVNEAETQTRTYLLPGGGYITIPPRVPSGAFMILAHGGTFTYIGSTAFLTPTVTRRPWLTYHEMMRA